MPTKIALDNVKVILGQDNVNDVLIALTNENHGISGGSGNDRIIGLGGNDILFGDEGNDTLLGGQGHDSLRGGAGNDSLEGGADCDRLWGEDGNDTLHGGAGNDYLHGGRGDDQINGGDGNDGIHGHQGNDTVNAGTGDDWMYGWAGNDLLRGEDGNDSFHGGTGNDTIEGGDGDDIMTGYTGNDLLSGGAGADVFGLVYGLHCEAVMLDMGHDTITDFEIGKDKIDLSEMAARVHDLVFNFDYIKQFLSENGNGDAVLSLETNVLHGRWIVTFEGVGKDDLSASDFIFGDKEVFIGSEVNDTMNGGDRNGRFYGQDGDDVINGGAGMDSINGGAGDDWIDGGRHSDRLYGCEGNDTLFGGNWHDYLEGGVGDDSMDGGNGNDRLRDGLGNDILRGGNGADTFIFEPTVVFGANPDAVYLDFQGSHDIIKDFEKGIDVVQILGKTLNQAMADQYLQEDGNGNSVLASHIITDFSKLHEQATWSITFEGVTDLTVDDFVFVC